MRTSTLLRQLVSVQGLFVRGHCFEPEGLVLDVVPAHGKLRCSECGTVAPRTKDARTRRWRDQDLGGMKLYLRYRIRRTHCPSCATVKTEAVSWAAPGSHFTHAFEERVACLAQQSSLTTVTKLMRTAWRTVGRIIESYVGRQLEEAGDWLDNLVNIGIDELSYRKHHKYITVVVDHDRKRIVWATEGKDAATLSRFFEELGTKRCELLKSITIDMSAAFQKAAREHAPDAKLIFDRFHVQRLAQDAADSTRRDEMREAPEDLRRELKGSRWAILKGASNLTAKNLATLEKLEELNRPIYRGYLLKEGLAAILDGRQINVARERLEHWIEEASASGLAHFKKVAGTIEKHIDGILEYVRTRMSNGRVEGLNSKARTITRRAYGFHSARSLISLLFLCCGGITATPAFRTPSGFH